MTLETKVNPEQLKDWVALARLTRLIRFSLLEKDRIKYCEIMEKESPKYFIKYGEHFSPEEYPTN